MPELGLGIITYNRKEALQACVERIRTHTRTPYQLVVADDGSTDGSAEWARSQGIRVITGQRCGVVWNRNRALACLMEWTACDPLILLEDDAWPSVPGWEQPWVEGSLRWGHLSYSLGVPGATIGGAGTPEDPFRCRIFGGICVATARAALWAVGFLDTRFRGYGYGHGEWSYRFARLFSGRWFPPVGGLRDLICLCLQSGIEPVDAGSWANRQDMERNERLLRRLLHEPIWRPPARNETELEILGEELAAALRLPPECVRERLREFGWLPRVPERQGGRWGIPAALRSSLPTRR